MRQLTDEDFEIESQRTASSRAIILNEHNQVYLVQCNYFNPENTGKWTTVGGRQEPEDQSERICLEREMFEELGENSAKNIEIKEKLGELTRNCEITGNHEITHHFYHCRLKPGCEIQIEQNHNEILAGQFFSPQEVSSLCEQGKTMLKVEFDYVNQILTSRHN